MAARPFENAFLHWVLDGGHGPYAADELVIDRKRDGSVRGVIYYGGQLAVAADDGAALDAFAIETRKHPGLRSFVGAKRTVDGLWNRVKSWHRPPAIVRERQPLYALWPQGLQPIDDVDVRLARDDETAIVAEGSARMILGELGYDPRAARSTFLAGVRQSIGQGLWWVWEVDGAVRFQCNVGAITPLTAQIQGVWTPPHLRGLGYATQGLAAISRRLLENLPDRVAVRERLQRERDRALRPHRLRARRRARHLPVFMKRALAVDAILIVLAAIVTQAHLPVHVIERAYANGAYAWLNATFVPMSNAVPFAVGDLEAALVCALVVAGWIVGLRGTRGRRLRAVLVLLAHTAALAAFVVIAFNLLWGWNYRRAPVATRVDFDAARVTATSVSRFADRIVAILNDDVGPAHARMQTESTAAMRAQLAARFLARRRAPGRRLERRGHRSQDDDLRALLPNGGRGRSIRSVRVRDRARFVVLARRGAARARARVVARRRLRR